MVLNWCLTFSSYKYLWDNVKLCIKRVSYVYVYLSYTYDIFNSTNRMCDLCNIPSDLQPQICNQSKEKIYFPLQQFIDIAINAIWRFYCKNWHFLACPPFILFSFLSPHKTLFTQIIFESFYMDNNEIFITCTSKWKNEWRMVMEEITLSSKNISSQLSYNGILELHINLSVITLQFPIIVISVLFCLTSLEMTYQMS